MKILKYIALSCLSVVLSGCFSPQAPTSLSDHYTRGIGVYPGNPKEDFSPKPVVDNTGYRHHFGQMCPSDAREILFRKDIFG